MPGKILQKEAPILRKTAIDVPIKAITSPRIKKIMTEMKKALNSEDDGVAIAAPQIGYSLRIFMVSGKVEKLKQGNKKIFEPKESAQVKISPKNTIYINPVIRKLSKEKKLVEEGCLSVRYLYGKVSRANKTTIVAYDETGKKFERGASGILAQIFQHETDHLNGVLFIDKAKNIEEIILPKHEI